MPVVQSSKKNPLIRELNLKKTGPNWKKREVPFCFCSYHKLGELHVELLLLRHGDGGRHSLLDEKLALATIFCPVDKVD